MYKNIKYNLIIVVLIMMMGVFLGAYNSLNSSFVAPDLPVPGQNDNLDPDENAEEMPMGKFTAPSKSAGEFTRIAFAFKVLAEGDGFYSETTQKIKSMGQIQNVFTKSYRGAKFNLIEEWKYASIPMAKNEFVIFYDDDTNIKYKKITDKNQYKTSPFEYNAEFSGQKQDYSAKEFESKYGNFNNFPITINSQTASILSYDKRSDKNNYIIKISVNVARVDKTYIDFFKFNGTDNVLFSDINITFKINKKTGFFSEIEKNEMFKTTYTGISVSCDATSTQSFKKVNTSVESKIQEISNKNF
jgi:hypothetical protein